MLTDWGRVLRSNQLSRHDSEATKVGKQAAAQFDGDGNYARAGGDDFARAKADVVRAEFVGDPGHGESRIAQHVGSDTFASESAVQQQMHDVRRQVDRTPIGGGRIPQHEMMSTRIVGDELRRADHAEVVVA